VEEQGDVPAAVALDRRFAGVVAIAAVSASGIPRVDAPATARLALERTVVSSADPPPHELLLAFGDDPIDRFRSLAIPARAGFASPFLATIPGTDAYTEDL
jgi:hypothetical protein